jgi:hypothetical protein
VLSVYRDFHGCGGDWRLFLENYEISDMSKILKTIDVSKWEILVDKYVRVKIVDGKITDIGNLIYEKWYTFNG